MDLLVILLGVGAIWIFVIALVLAMCKAAARADEAISMHPRALTKIHGSGLVLGTTQGQRERQRPAAV
jgi:hypothetical protein